VVGPPTSALGPGYHRPNAIAPDVNCAPVDNAGTAGPGVPHTCTLLHSVGYPKTHAGACWNGCTGVQCLCDVAGQRLMPQSSFAVMRDLNSSSQRTPLCHQEGMAAPRLWARVLKILSGQLAAVRAALRAHATRPHVKHAAPRGMSALASICAATVRACGSFQTAERARQSQALELARMRSVPSGAVNLAWMFRRHQPPADPSQRAAHEPETLCARSSTKLD
jgi:hypothetical protein